MGVDGEDPITVAGVVIRIGPKIRNGEMPVLVSLRTFVFRATFSISIDLCRRREQDAKKETREDACFKIQGKK